VKKKNQKFLRVTNDLLAIS